MRDGDLNADQVKIELDRSGPSEEVVNDVTVNQTVFDIGYGTVFVLQVVSICGNLTKKAGHGFNVANQQGHKLEHNCTENTRTLGIKYGVYCSNSQKLMIN